MLRLSFLLAVLAVSLAAGCDNSPPAPPSDAGRRDSGAPRDAGTGDAGAPADSGAQADAGPIPDSGPRPDAGPGDFDAGFRDCPSEDLGSMVGEDVAVDTVDGRGNFYYPTCAEVRNGEDLDYRWAAPSTGEWTFDTLGSDYDTVLALYDADGCTDGPELACNDDTPETIHSVIRRTMTEGDVVLIVVNEFRSFDVGDFRLSIHRDVPTTETACDDSADDDRDGAIDCEDPDCAGVGTCP